MRSRDTVLTLVIGLALICGPATAAPEELDPIVAQVVAMLEAGVSEELVLQWLESTGRRPQDIGAQGVIALTEGGASEQLIMALLQLVEELGTEPVGRSAPGPGPPSSESPGPIAVPHDPRATSEEGVQAIVELRAKRIWTDEPEPDGPQEPRWDVYLYLDGELVAWSRPTLQGDPVEARRTLRAGQRELRVVLQRYEELRSEWLYESLLVPTLIGFKARPGEPIEIDVEMKRIWGLWRQRSDGGPLSYTIRQGDRVLAEHPGTGGDPDRWRPVCEDVEANFPDAEKVPRRFRSLMSRCVRWADLWTGSGRSSSRSEILAALAEYDFQPPVR